MMVGGKGTRDNLRKRKIFWSENEEEMLERERNHGIIERNSGGQREEERII